MKFAAKYEILEPVTRGAVETFMARSIATDDRVLIHIFECPEQRPDQPTVQWVLEAFRAIAPDPAEFVLATGRYSGTSYAYLATKLPGSAALQAWVRSYEERQEKDEEVTSSEGAPVPALTDERMENPLPSAGGTEESTVVRGQPGKVSTIIEALRLEPSLVPETNETPNVGRAAAAALSDTIIDFGGTDFRVVEKVQQRERGESRNQFSGSGSTPKDPAQAFQNERPQAVDSMDEVLGLLGEPGQRAGTVSPREAPGGGSQESVPDSSRPAEAAGITGVFRLSAVSQPRTAPSDTASGNQSDGKSGEFTRFFQGPFQGERPSETPLLSPPPPQPQKQPGEFTEVFGNSEGSPSQGTSTRKTPVRDVLVGGNSAAPAHLIEGAGTGPKIPETHEPSPQQTDILERNSRKFPVFTEWASSSVPVSLQPLVDSPAEPPIQQFGSGKSWGDEEEALAFRSKADATRVFSAPEKELMSDSSSTAAGLSDFTRIISGGLVEHTLVEEPLMPPESRKDFVERPGATPGVFQVLPSPPAASPPPQLQRPDQFPQMPAPPTVATPPASAVSRLGSVSPKPAGVPWTLIIINGLVIIAVVLLFYFALKH